MSSTALTGPSSQALAACLPAGGTNFICSGAETVGQAIVLDNANVSTVPGFSVDTGGTATALSVTGNGAIRYHIGASGLSGAPEGLVVRSLGDAGATAGSVFIDTQADIHGSNIGLVVSNAGTGTIDVLAMGTITGGVGVLVGTNTGSGVQVATSTIYADEVGIAVGNDGTGDTVVTTGPVLMMYPGGSNAVMVSNGPTARNLTVEVRGFAQSFATGIWAQNQGIGATNVSAMQLVFGQNGPGIFVENGANTTGLSVTVEDVYGQTTGIAAVNGGGGPTVISSSGDVVGITGSGIGSANANRVTEVVIQANNASGQQHGISVLHEGTGVLGIASTGLARGENEAGIYAEAFGAGLVIEANDTRGGIDGIRAFNYGDGVTAISSFGTATGSRAGILAVNGVGSDFLRMETADVSGGEIGIFAANAGLGAMRVAASGHLHSDGLYGIYAVNGQVDPALLWLGPVVGPGGTDLIVEAATVTGAVAAENHGTGQTRVTTTGMVTGGIYAQNRTDATNITMNVADASGDTLGLGAWNAGSGATALTATGHIESDLYGILAVNGGGFDPFDDLDPAGTDLTIVAESVSGQLAIFARNHGTGATAITANGHIDGGVWAFNAETATDLNVAISTLDGVLLAFNGGTGATDVTVAGNVTGGVEIDGMVSVLNEETATDLNVALSGLDGTLLAINEGTGVTDITVAGNITGEVQILGEGTTLNVETQAVESGILAVNGGTGATRILANGSVGSAAGFFGMIAANGLTATDLAVDVGDVSGQDAGLLAINSGLGATNIGSAGHLQGGYFGLMAVNGGMEPFGDTGFDTTGAGGTDLTVDVESVSGQLHGLVAVNNGAGETRVRASGPVRGGAETGIAAINGGVTYRGSGEIETMSTNLMATDLAVEAFGDVHGGRYGLLVANLGTGDTTVTSTGTVTSEFQGMTVHNRPNNATGVTIDANTVLGGDVGIYTDASTVDLTVRGLVAGGIVGVRARAAGGNPIDILIAGPDAQIANLSGSPSDQAVWTTGGAAVLTNQAQLTGTVRFDQYDDLIINEGVWSVGGLSDFGDGTDRVYTAAGGAIHAAHDASRAETATFAALETFATAGLFSLADGGAGDVARTGADVTFQAGANYAIDIGLSGVSDLFTTTGALELEPGVTLTLSADGGFSRTRYTILTAEGGLTGQFTVIENAPTTAFLTLEDNYDANNAYLDAVQFRDFADAALTPNQLATAGALDALGVGELTDAVAGLPDDATAQLAFDHLSGEIHASAAGTFVQDSRVLRDAITNRIRAAFGADTPAPGPVLAYGPGGPRIETADPELFALWGHASGRWGHRDGDGNAAGFDTDARHFIVGADGSVEDWRLGFLAGYSHTGFSASDRTSVGDADSYHLGIYGGREWNDLAFRTGFIHSWHDVSTTRAAVFPGFAEMLSADYDARTAQIFGELAYGIDTGAARFEPFANLAYVRHATDGYTERGGVAALSSTGSTIDATFTTLGLRAETRFALGTVEAKLRGMVGWQHAFGDVTPYVSHAFAGGTPFTVSGAPIARNAALVELGFDVGLTPSAMLGLSYGGQFASDAADNAFKASLSVKF